jgi:type II secretory pathway component GspD/PulD (secretin)
MNSRVNPAQAVPPASQPAVARASLPALRLRDRQSEDRRSNHRLALAATVLAMALSCAMGQAQQASPTAAPATAAAPAAGATEASAGKEAQTKQPTSGERRKANRLYMDAGKQFVAGNFEEAMQEFEQAAALEPANKDYRLSAEVARSHAVTALIQASAKDRLLGNDAGARAALQRALELDPKNAEATEHMDELGDEALRDVTKPLYGDAGKAAGEAPQLQPTPGKQVFHLRTDSHQVIEQVFRAYGIQTMIDTSVSSAQVRLDLDDASFEEATQALALVTKTFYVPLDAHRVVVAHDTRENRQQFTRQQLETVYLSGLSAEEMTQAVTLAKNVFDMQQAAADNSAGTITVRAPPKTLNAFNATLRDLLDGRSQVLIDVRILQIAHTSQRNNGVQLPQSITAFNVYTEEQSILNANQALVQQIISSGLAAPGDTLAILGILVASGQVSSSLFSNGIALFGGGLTASALAPGTVTAQLSLNSSDTRELDQIQLRLGDGQAATLKEGERYPIQTSSYSNLSSSAINIPGLTTAGTSSNLSSLLGSLNSTAANIPMVQYQDLGLTLKATPGVMRNGDVALTLDLKIDALSGSSIDGNPILNNRAYSGVITVPEGGAVVLAGELDKSESRAISGTPGLSEIPGLNQLTAGNDIQKNYATLLIILTPHLVRGTQAAGHTAMMRVDTTTSTSAGR